MEQTAPNPAPGTTASLDPALADAKLGGEEAHARPLGTRIHKAARDALSAMHGASAELHSAIETVRGDGVRRQHGTRGSTTTGDVRVVSGGKLRSFSGNEGELVDAASRRFSDVARRVDRSLADLGEAETTLADAVTVKLRDPNAQTPAGVALASEVRAHLRGMDKAKRAAFVSERVEAGDLSTVAAMLSAPAYLSGLGADEVGVVRKLAERKFAPVESAALASARQARELVENAGRSFATAWTQRVRDLGPGNQKRDEAISTLAKGGAA